MAPAQPSVSTLRISDVYKPTMSATALAPFLDVRHAERQEACRIMTSLFANHGRTLLSQASKLIEPLLALSTEEPAALRPLATAGRLLWGIGAYPEARVCLEAALAAPGALGLDKAWNVPWRNVSGEREYVEGEREQALLELYYAECLLAAGNAEDGERVFRQAFASAERAKLPAYIQVSVASADWGYLPDFRVFALTRAARAIRLRLMGRDICVSRKLPKSRRPPPGDPRALETATTYPETALLVVAPRAREQYAGLTPDPVYLRDFTPIQRDYAWQWQTYFEAALFDEVNGNADRARRRMGQALLLVSLQDPTCEYQKELAEAAARLGAIPTPL